MFTEDHGTEYTDINW